MEQNNPLTDALVSIALLNILKNKDILIIGRNKTNDQFMIQSKENYENSKDTEKIIDISEDQIINLIESNRNKFFTINLKNDSIKYTVVIVVDEHIKSVNNFTKIDNIGNLPITIK